MQLGGLCGQLDIAGRQADLKTIAELAQYLDAYHLAAAEAIRAGLQAMGSTVIDVVDNY